jgi:putative sterol carrier protein
MKFLSEAWVRALVESLQAPEGAGLTIWYRLPEPEAEFWLTFSSGEVDGATGTPEHADLTLSCDRDTMQALSRSELLPQAAFMQGRLEITGNMTKLIENKDLIATLGPAMSGLEAEY